MQEKLLIKKTKETPEVHLDKAEGVFRIEGRSLPENTLEFYAPVIEWFTNYNQNPNQETELEIFLEYLNSGSLKQLFRIIYLMEDLMELGNDSKIVWKYRKNDELMREKGREFKQFLNLQIDVIEA